MHFSVPSPVQCTCYNLKVLGLFKRVQDFKHAIKGKIITLALASNLIALSWVFEGVWLVTGVFRFYADSLIWGIIKPILSIMIMNRYLLLMIKTRAIASAIVETINSPVTRRWSLKPFFDESMFKPMSFVFWLLLWTSVPVL